MQPIDQADRLLIMGGPTPDRHAEFARDVLEGLSKTQKTLPCRHIYDKIGSQLFEQICDLPEYYLTRAEAQILEDHADAILAHMGPNCELVELGSGSAEKTRVLIEAALQIQPKLAYRPIDISRDALLSSAASLLRDFPNLYIEAYAGEYVRGLHELATDKPEQGPARLVLWLGSSVGNFERRAAAQFLRVVSEELVPGDRVLLGVDLRKSKPILDAAYDDPAGVTARFNKNLLVRINHELGGTFPLDEFEYVADYEIETGRVKMSLLARRACTVHVEELDRSFEFGAGETIETEDSYKYSLEEIDQLASDAGFKIQDQWLDTEGRFSTSLLRLK